MESGKGETEYIPLVKSDKSTPSTPPRRPTMASVIFFKFFRPCIAEMLGTMTFVFVDVCSVSLGNYAGFTHGFILFVNVAATATVSVGGLSAAFTHGFVLFVLVASTANISGGHLNPAVTLALTIVRGLQPIILAPLYVLAQLLGGIIGAALARAAMSSTMYDEINGGVHMLDSDVGPGEGILAEAVATSILVLAVLMVAFDDNSKSVLAPLAIGLAVGGGIFAIGTISGGSMNPARSFGPAVVRNYWKYHYVYWVGPILGSLFSTLMYGLFLASPNRLWLPIYEPV